MIWKVPCEKHTRQRNVRNSSANKTDHSTRALQLKPFKQETGREREGEAINKGMQGISERRRNVNKITCKNRDDDSADPKKPKTKKEILEPKSGTGSQSECVPKDGLICIIRYLLLNLPS
jgi:hypothetical protein